MRDHISDIAIVIPSLSPGKELVEYSKELIKYGFNNIIVVNDGSSTEYDHIFNSLKEHKEITILKHEVNKGKGAGLKTAFKYLKNNGNVKGILAVDSDGQHLPKDCIKIAEEMLKGERGLYLGCRDFNDPRVPWKSRTGNRMTSFFFERLYKQKLSDTQTGLRGFLIEDLDLMINTEGDRYEYEMEQLIKACLNNLRLICIPIETVYIDNNEGSHFRPLKDGLKIYKILFRKHNK